MQPADEYTYQIYEANDPNPFVTTVRFSNNYVVSVFNNLSIVRHWCGLLL